METVRMIKRIMRPVAETGIIHLAELNECIAQLTSLAEHGKPKAEIIPRLVDMREAATILGIGLSNFKRLESICYIKIKGKVVSVSILYCYLKIFNSIEEFSTHTHYSLHKLD